MAQPKNLLIGSTEAYSGKSATVLGVIEQFQAKNLQIAFGKPLGTCLGDPDRNGDSDVAFVAEMLQLAPDRLRFPLLKLNEDSISKRLQGHDTTDYCQLLQQYLADISGDLVVLEGPGTLWEGGLFNLSMADMAVALEASVLLVTRYSWLNLGDLLLSAQQVLKHRLLGVLINDIPEGEQEIVQTQVVPYLQRHGIEVFGTLPSSELLRSISVREIAEQLQAEILSRPDRLDLMVGSLAIGAMNVNAALEYFRKGRNMAIVTGSDRTDLQLAALETSTHCLILTGHMQPQPMILSRAEDLEIPILAVNLDTLTTVEIIDRAFGQVRLQEPIKVKCIQELMAAHFDIDKLLDKLGIKPPILA